MCSDSNRCAGKLPFEVKEELCEMLRESLFDGPRFGAELEFGDGIFIQTRFGAACSQQKVHMTMRQKTACVSCWYLWGQM